MHAPPEQTAAANPFLACRATFVALLAVTLPAKNRTRMFEERVLKDARDKK
jgi:hypothetical protein